MLTHHSRQSRTYDAAGIRMAYAMPATPLATTPARHALRASDAPRRLLARTFHGVVDDETLAARGCRQTFVERDET